MKKEATESKGSTHGPSFLRWAGSKRKSLLELTATYNDEERQYVEPFAGSAALFFSLQPKAALLGDLNGHLINAMRYVRDEPQNVFDNLARLERSKETYYRIRSAFNELKPHGLESAVFFIYLNRNCFNGLWRTNKKGAFNVPYGGVGMGGNPPLDLIRGCSIALKKASLHHQDFRKTIERADETAFIYADPPYFTSTERTFIEYGKKSFGKKDLSDLIEMLVHAANNGAHVVLTYNKSMPLKKVPSNWARINFEVTRNVGGFKGARKKQTEIIYISPHSNGRAA